MAVSGSIGQPLRRKEDARLLRGQGRFSDDFSLPGQAYTAMVRSPHPHARIVAIETGAARAMPGVVGIYTGTDVLADGLGAIPHNPVPSNRYDLKLRAPDGGAIFFGPHVLLPADKARHVGEAVAMVVAETRAQAEDAAEAVRVTWAPLPFVVDTAEAAEARRPRCGTRCRRTSASIPRSAATRRRWTPRSPAPPTSLRATSTWAA